MNQELYRKLKTWRQEKADKRMCELYRILTNKTLEDIAALVPTSREELLRVKGIGEKKFQAYGVEILRIIQECVGVPAGNDVSDDDEQKLYSVSDFLGDINFALSHFHARVRGEVSSCSFKGHLYFSLKDAEDGSVMQCFMWARDYELAGVCIEEGMEVIIEGFAEVYKPNGKFTFRAATLELSGEGALKKAYEELREKLEAEGLFAASRKKPLPEYPRRIGLITSRDGAVINDFLNNIGRFGFSLRFFDSRVEGMLAVKELIKAVKYFQKNSVDVLVIIRGGGSLESLQAFNNEAFIRELVQLKMPVMCGIGHDKDMPLLAYVADGAYSTPSIVAKELNSSWEKGIAALSFHEDAMLRAYEHALKGACHDLDNAAFRLRTFYQDIFQTFQRHGRQLESMLAAIGQHIRHQKQTVATFPKLLGAHFARLVSRTVQMIDGYEKVLYHASPERQLALGYSIVKRNGKVIRSVKNISAGDHIEVRLSDGTIGAEVVK